MSFCHMYDSPLPPSNPSLCLALSPKLTLISFESLIMADSDQAGPSEQKGEVEEQEEAKEKEKEKPWRNRTSGFYEIRKREIGGAQPRIFSRRIGGSEALIRRMSQYGKLYGHRGCVNTVSFNPDGGILVSGSDDKDIVFWDWSVCRKSFSYNSGHLDNIFQASVMPFTDDRTVVSSAADGQVRVGQIKEGGDVSTKQIGSHMGRVHKLAIEPGSPHSFFSCGDDGLVQHFDLRMPEPVKLFVCSPMPAHRQICIPLTSIVIDPRNPNFFSVGGSDQFARVYDIRICSTTSRPDPISTDRPINTFCPTHLIKPSERVRITGLSYSSTSELLVSYNDELLYNFQKESGLGPDPLSTQQPDPLDPLHQHSQGFEGHRNAETVKGVSYFGMRDEYVVSGSDCGHVYVWRKKDGELVCMMNGDKHVVNCVASHPYFPFLASSGFDKSVKLWTPTASRSGSFPKNAKEVMERNKSGREEGVGEGPDIVMHVLRLRRRQTIAYIERRSDRRNRDDDDDDDDVGAGRGEAILVGFTDRGVDGQEEESEEEDPRECVIS
ncbi:hypothetical protein LUZ60_013035 [Juncus effusus]|nr:hypothetical protein LUZ60_013035 [Juncus effusus]